MLPPGREYPPGFFDEDPEQLSFLREVDTKLRKAAKSEEKLKGVTPGKVRTYAVQVEVFLKAGDWTPATPSHVVCLYSWCHEKVYGIAPMELEGGKTFTFAAIHVAKFLRDMFGNDVTDLVTFLRWVWKREDYRHKSATNAGNQRSRLTWRMAFSASFFTDWRMATMQKRGTNADDD